MTKAQMKKEETVAKTKEPAKVPLRRKELRPNRTDPFALMRQLTAEMENMMTDFGFEPRFLAPNWTADFLTPEFAWVDETPFLPENIEFFNKWSPEIEMFKRDDHLIIRADLPGLKKEDVKIDITDKYLTLEGERKNEMEEKKEGFYRSELSYGSFYRRIPLPEGIKTENAKAIFKNGVLEISMEAPKLANAGKKLEITEG